MANPLLGFLTTLALCHAALAAALPTVPSVVSATGRTTGSTHAIPGPPLDLHPREETTAKAGTQVSVIDDVPDPSTQAVGAPKVQGILSHSSNKNTCKHHS